MTRKVIAASGRRRVDEAAARFAQRTVDKTRRLATPPGRLGRAAAVGHWVRGHPGTVLLAAAGAGVLARRASRRMSASRTSPTYGAPYPVGEPFTDTRSFDQAGTGPFAATSTGTGSLAGTGAAAFHEPGSGSAFGDTHR